jgi:hypothetical protein
MVKCDFLFHVRTGFLNIIYTSFDFKGLNYILFNPSKPHLVYTTFKNLARTSKKTQHFSITKISWLMLFKEIITVRAEIHTKPTNTLTP